MLPAKHKKLILSSSQGGQGILEVIVTIGIGTIMIMALVVLSIRTNRSSDFSKASSQASNLAAEGIEIINNLKEINGTDPTDPSKLLFRYNNLEIGCSGNVSALLDDHNWDFLFTKDIEDNSCGSNPGRVGYITPSGCNSTVYNCIYFGGNEASNGSVIVDTRTYTREVFIADTPIAPSGKSNCNTNDDTNPNVGDWDNIKQFTVVVSWTDSSGTHNQTQTACYQR